PGDGIGDYIKPAAAESGGVIVRPEREADKVLIGGRPAWGADPSQTSHRDRRSRVRRRRGGGGRCPRFDRRTTVMAAPKMAEKGRKGPGSCRRGGGTPPMIPCGDNCA